MLLIPGEIFSGDNDVDTTLKLVLPVKGMRTGRSRRVNDADKVVR